MAIQKGFLSGVNVIMRNQSVALKVDSNFPIPEVTMLCKEQLIQKRLMGIHILGVYSQNGCNDGIPSR